MIEIKVVPDNSPIVIKDPWPECDTITFMPLPDFDGYCRIKYVDQFGVEIKLKEKV